MISRLTLGLLLVGLLIPSGMAVWMSGHRDSCSRFLSGDKSLPPTQMVAMGTEMMEVPCTVWIPRQPLAIQMLCLIELVTVLVLAIHIAGDVQDWRRMRRGNERRR